MAASRGNGRQPDNSQIEQQEQRTQPRRRLRRNPQKQPLMEIARIPPPPPKRSLRRMIRGTYPNLLSMRSNSALSRPLNSRQTREKTALSGRSVQPVPSESNIVPERPSPMAPRATFRQNSTTQEFRTQEMGYNREQKTSTSNQPVNPWQVQHKTPPSQLPLSRTSNPTPQGFAADRGGNRREPMESAKVQPFPKPNHLGRRLESNSSRSMAKGNNASAPSGKASGRRVKPKAVSPTAPIQTPQPVRRPRKRPGSPLLYIIRLLILGIGIGAIVGTLLSALDPATQASVKVKETPASQVQPSPSPVSRVTPMALNQEIMSLKAQLQAVIANNPNLQPGFLIVDLDTSSYVDVNSRSTFPAASTIKVPILVALFQDVDEGKVRLDETLTLESDMVATGSGDLQYKKLGTKYTVLELATKMIVISDNTATNMLISRLGGMDALNQRFRSWGLTATALNNPLPDLEGTNVTSPQELANLLSIVNQGHLVSLASRDRMLNIMQNNQIDSLLPKGLGSGAVIAHKTGNIGSMLADVGLVNMPTGKRYLISVMVKRPFNDPSAQELIRQISQTAYGYFNQADVSPNTTSMPIDSTATGTKALARNPVPASIPLNNYDY